MAEDLEKLTTFFTRFVTLKYLVMLYNFCDGPAFWQHLINNTLYDFLHRFILTYLDDIFIFNKMLKSNISMSANN